MKIDNRKERSLKAFILGAGCSVCGNYPMARGIPAGLKEFVLELEKPGTRELKRCVEQTINLLAEHRADTLDQLAQRDSKIIKKMIVEAKIATSAYFLSLEDKAVDKAYPCYAKFFEELFIYGESPTLMARLSATLCRVLTYNYDRLFERTFRKWITQHDPKLNQRIETNPKEFYKLVNAAIGDTEGIHFDPNTFALLKLHGGIGQYHKRDGGSNYPYRPEIGGKIEIADNAFFSTSPAVSPVGPREPLIFFPADKKEWDERMEQTESTMRQNRPFDYYSSKVWQEAKRIVGLAGEIHIIGYSMQSVDIFDFKTILRLAPTDSRIVLRNVLSEQGRLLEKIEIIRDELSAKWAVEYRGEKFYGEPDAPTTDCRPKE